jgi:ketosteroid isomerase-like protein
MKRLTSSAFVLLLIVSGVFAQTAPDAAELTKLLNDFLAGASRNDPAAHERFWADDLIYTRSAGRRVSKAEIMKDVRSAPAPKPTDPKTVYTAEDIQIQQYGDAAIVAFRLVSTTDNGGSKQVANNLNSGTFVKRNGKWQVVSWQSTRMPRTEEESKREVTDADAAFHQALATADVNKLTALTASNFAWTQGMAQMSLKQVLDELSAGRLKYVKPDAAKSSVSVYGETAVARGEWPESSGRYTLTFINQIGGWKAIALHTSTSK